MSDQARYVVNIDSFNYKDRMYFCNFEDAKLQYDSIISNSEYNDCAISLWDLVEDKRPFYRDAIEGAYNEN